MKEENYFFIITLIIISLIIDVILAAMVTVHNSNMERVINNEICSHDEIRFNYNN